MRTSAKTMTRSSTMSQPTAMRPRSVSRSRFSCKTCKTTTVLATERASPKMMLAPPAPTEDLGKAEAEEGHEDDLPDGARHGDGSDCQKVLQGEVQSDAEHEQDDPDLGELWCQSLI